MVIAGTASQNRAAADFSLEQVLTVLQFFEEIRHPEVLNVFHLRQLADPHLHRSDGVQAVEEVLERFGFLRGGDPNLYADLKRFLLIRNNDINNL